MKKYLKPGLLVLLMLSHPWYACQSKTSNKTKSDSNQLSFNLDNPQATSLFGQPLNSAEPSEELIQRWTVRKDDYMNNPDDVDNIIWFGRFTAYMGNYKEAIRIYTEGISKFPEDARLFRHRGHRYISIRKFDQAIADLEHAKQLIHGSPNQVEPDGMPNARNIPVSSLHGNVYYHLGLAYYLKGDFENALKSYEMCLETSTKPDNVVSASHWLYMILRLLNRNEDASTIVENIDDQMDIIENFSYHKLCLLYNNTLQERDLMEKEESASANDAVRYGIANWHNYNDRTEKGRAILESIVKSDSWNSFGYIAAEADLSRIRE